jgi:hypothetical protein
MCERFRPGLGLFGLALALVALLYSALVFVGTTRVSCPKLQPPPPSYHATPKAAFASPFLFLHSTLPQPYIAFALSRFFFHLISFLFSIP